jgi:hypothetical protein
MGMNWLILHDSRRDGESNFNALTGELLRRCERGDVLLERRRSPVKLGRQEVVIQKSGRFRGRGIRLGFTS